MSARRAGLDAAFDTPEAKRAYVRRLFSTIASRYDLITVLLSYGQDRRWKRRVVRLASPTSATLALDLACGTGDIAFGVADRGARVVALDITREMLALARRRLLASSQFPGSGGQTSFVNGDMMSLPFPDGQFDLVTAGYGIRNVPDIHGALAEIHRVLKPGGTFLSLDFNRPRNAVVRAVYLTYLSIVGSALGFVLHRDPDTYRYIPASIRRYPGAAAVSAAMLRLGFTSSEYMPVFGGLMAIHKSVK